MEKIKMKLEEALLEVGKRIDEAIEKGEEVVIDRLTTHETRLKAHIADLEADIKSLEEPKAETGVPDPEANPAAVASAESPEPKNL
jgi:hypothetical protein